MKEVYYINKYLDMNTKCVTSLNALFMEINMNKLGIRGGQKNQKSNFELAN